MRRLLAVLVALLAFPAGADAALTSKSLTFTASDGAKLHADVGGHGNLDPRPLIVEFSPYAPACCGNDFGPDYNYVQVHARGTGKSTGVWGAVGPRDQQDVSEFLQWVCGQPFSNGHIGLYGFSASAIAVYNSMHLPLACVDAAALMAGTNDLYRDLLYPGGILNLVPGAVVGLGVGGLLLSASIDKPIEGLQSGLGFLGTVTSIFTHQSRDSFWEGHSQRPGPNHFPVLADTGFYDPEARGPFESFKALKADGAHLMILGAHDGWAASTGGPFPQYRRWFDRYLLGQANGIDSEPRVKLWLGNGSREALLAGNYTRVDADDWPVPGTKWRKLFLGGDRTLRDTAPLLPATQIYPSVLSIGTSTDPQTTSVTGTSLSMIPGLTDMTLGSIGAATWTSPALSSAIDVAGPAALDVFVSSTSPEADLHAVVADVWPDGRAFPVGVGRLRMSYPKIDAARSLVDETGEVVQPYNDFRAKQPAGLLQTREYRVEFWPIGNRFGAGHRIRLYLVGTSSFMLPAIPGLNIVSVGGSTKSRLLLPVLP
jgi:predicted acyl esterase